jgi:hypothetical protein
MSGRPTDYEFLAGVLARAGTADGVSPAARAAAGRTVRDWAAGTLRAVADGRKPLRAVIHPLGFTCLPVERAGRDGVCVHVWSPQAVTAAPAAPAVHAHSWELTSYALAGELENRLMTVADAFPGQREPAARLPLPARPGLEPVPALEPLSASAVYQVLRVRSEGDVDELNPTRQLVHCHEARREHVTAGDTYGVPAGVFHVTSVAPQADVVTVALGRMIDGVEDLALAPPGASSHQVRRRRRDEARTALTARLVLDRLEGPWPADGEGVGHAREPGVAVWPTGAHLASVWATRAELN